MKIKELYIYPIKSLRGISITSSDLTQQGLQYDRCFMLLKVLPDGILENMHISIFWEMSLFHTSINTNSLTPNEKEITVTYQTPKVPLLPFHPDQSRSIRIPLKPEFGDLQTIDVKMHQSPTFAYQMPDEFNSWFSNCFGFPVILAYLGDGLRQALGSISPNASTKAPPNQSKSSWLSSLSPYLRLPGQFQGFSEDKEANNEGITFADCAPFLVVSLSSLAQIHPRLQETESADSRDDEPVQMDVKKFRPNLILDGDPDAPWDEDFWGELTVAPRNPVCLPMDLDNDIERENECDNEKKTRLPAKEIRIILTGNCGRCKSINIDYETGKQAVGPSGSVLKKLMKDRRVDKGVKYSPVFGRYGFLDNWKEGAGRVSVGDEVVVSKRNMERTVFQWPGLTN